MLLTDQQRKRREENKRKALELRQSKSAKLESSPTPKPVSALSCSLIHSSTVPLPQQSDMNTVNRVKLFSKSNLVSKTTFSQDSASKTSEIKHVSETQ